MAGVFDVKSWLGSLKTKYNIPDEDLPVRDIEGGFLRQDDYNRKQQQLSEEHKQRMLVEDKFHNDLLTAKQKLDLIGQLEEQYGAAETWSPALQQAIGQAHPGLANDPKGRGGQNFTATQVQEMIAAAVQGVITEHVAPLQNRIEAYGQGSAVMIDFMAEAPSYWRDEYGGKFPKKEFTEFFAKSGTNDPHIAFKLFEGPYADKKREEKYKTDLEAAEQKGYQSAMSKHGIAESPITTSSTGMFFKGNAPKPEIDPATGQPKALPPEMTHDERKAKVGSAFVKALAAGESGQIPGVTPGK
jgi:hypothetical protein